MSGEIDVFETLSGVPFQSSVVKTEPLSKTLPAIDNWLTTVGSIFDKGMDIYQSATGRVQAQDIIRSEQVSPPTLASVPPKVVAAAYAEAVTEQFKNPIIIGGVVICILLLFVIYKQG